MLRRSLIFLARVADSATRLFLSLGLLPYFTSTSPDDSFFLWSRFSLTAVLQSGKLFESRLLYGGV